MRKQNLILTIFFFLVTTFGAFGRTVEEARVIAKSFFDNTLSEEEVLRSRENYQLAYCRHRKMNNQLKSLYYVFNRGEKDGFVFVSGDNSSVPVLGYSLKGAFDTLNIPPALENWMDDYAYIIDSLSENSSQVTLRSFSDNNSQTLTTPIEPLLGYIQFGQNYPFNTQCPVLNNGTQSVVGCVATAMAQIMKYYQWPDSTVKTIPAYTSTKQESFNIDSIPNISIDWNNVLSNYNFTFATQEQYDAVASLSKICGSSVKMAYGSSSSASITDIPSALPNYFNYAVTSRYMSRSYYDTFHWLQLINNELENHRPVIYRGARSTGYSHAYICDGRDDNGLFHVNWGWNGINDGYYDITFSRYTYGQDGYSGSQSAVLGIVPNNDSFSVAPYLIAASRSVYSDTLMRNSEGIFDSASVSYSLKVGFDAVFDGDWGIGYYNDEDSLIVLWSDSIYVSESTLENYNANFSCNLGDGQYKLYPVYKLRDSENWLLMQKQSSLQTAFIATVNQDTLTFSSYLYGILDNPTIEVEGSGLRYANHIISCNVSNVGWKDYAGTFYVYLDTVPWTDGEQDVYFASTNVIELGGNPQSVFSFDFVPQTAGMYYVAFSQQSTGKSILLKSDSFLIEDYPILNVENISLITETDTLYDCHRLPLLKNGKVDVSMTISNKGSEAEPVFYFWTTFGMSFNSQCEIVEDRTKKEFLYSFSLPSWCNGYGKFFYSCSAFDMEYFKYYKTCSEDSVLIGDGNSLSFYVQESNLSTNDEEIFIKENNEYPDNIEILNHGDSYLLISHKSDWIYVSDVKGTLLFHFYLEKEGNKLLLLPPDIYIINNQKFVLN